MVDSNYDGVNSYLLADDEENNFSSLNKSNSNRKMRTELGLNYVSSDLVNDAEGGYYIEHEQISSNKRYQTTA